MRISWLGGWAISPATILAAAAQRWPAAEHVVVTPGPRWAEELARQLQPGDRLAAYSLGAFLLLRAKAPPLPPEHMTLLAPFFDLRREEQLGGRVQQGRLRYMIRRLARDPRAAVAEFYQSAALTIEPPAELPYALDELAWGLEQLYQPPGEVRLAAFRHATALAGSRDPLIDAPQLGRQWSQLRVIAGADHNLSPLLDFVI
ncbi:MAG: hypothetical protein IT424_00420 [Pirellulales bacterium]|nr:hypothetical protein [Pirellulales bacterium]